MNTRLIISLLSAGALAFACGPRPNTGVQSLAAIGNQSLLSVVASVRPHASEAPEPAAPSTTPTLNSRLNVNATAKAVRFTLAVTNVSKKHVELTFPNGKAYDFVVVDSVGREVWHWSTGRLFTQTSQNKLLGQGESMRVEEEWKQPAHGGRFTAIGVVNSTNYPIEHRVEFVVP